MSAGPTGQQQSRLLPYLVVILAVLLAYVLWTRVISPPRPAAVMTTPLPVAASPAPAATPTARPETAASPSPTASPSPGPVVVPPGPSGRPNPFAALVTEQAARPAPPPAPAVPPPFFPGQPGRPGEAASGGGTKLAGVLMKDGESLAIVQLGQTTYIVAEGDMVEQFRVARIEPERVVLRSGTQELSLELGGEQK